MLSVCLLLTCRTGLLVAIVKRQMPCGRDDEELHGRQLTPKRCPRERGWEGRPRGGSAPGRAVPADASVRASATRPNVVSLSRTEDPLKEPPL